MQFTIDIPTGARSIALTRALAAYNQRNEAMDEAGFVQLMVENALDSLVKSYVVTTLSKLAFLNRFTPEERIAIRTAAQASPAVEDYLEMLKVSEEVDVTHDLTVAGVQALEAGGLLAEGRAAQILAL